MKLTWPIGWLWFTTLQFKPTVWAQSYSRKHTKCTTPLQERHFPTPLCHAEKQPLYWNWAKLSLQSSLLYSPKFNVDKPTWRLGYSLWPLLKTSHLTLKNSMRCVKKFSIILATVISGIPMREIASYRGSWGEWSSPRGATALHSDCAPNHMPLIWTVMNSKNVKVWKNML